MSYQDAGEGKAPLSVRGRVRPLAPVSITVDESDPWRVPVTVCTVDGSCVDAARGVMAKTTATEKEVNN